MKFSVIIQLNAWQDWYEHYIAYDSLKKWLYLVEKAKLGFLELPDSYRNVDPDVFIRLGNRNYNSPRLSAVAIGTAQTPRRSAPSDLGLGAGPSERTPLLLSVSTNNNNNNNNNTSTGAASSDSEALASQQQLQQSSSPVTPTTPSALSRRSQLESFFIEPLDDQLLKIKRFYAAKKAELCQRIEDLAVNVALVEGFDITHQNTLINSNALMSNTPNPASGSSSTNPNASPSIHQSSAPFQQPARKTSRRSMSSSFNTSDSESTSSSWAVTSLSSAVASASASHPNTLSYNFWNKPGNKLQRGNFRSQSSALYAELKELQEYVLMNHNGFAKILKKYEKVTGFRLKTKYMAVVEKTSLFTADEAAGLREAIERVVEIYARVATDNDLRNARVELDSKCRQRITIERNTVWKDMVEVGGRTMSIVEARRKPDGELEDDGSFCGWLWSRLVTPRFIILMILLGVFYGLINYNLFETVEAQNCFAIFVFASGMWAFEIVPLFVTSAMVPFLVVVFRVMRDTVVLPDGTITHPRLDAKGQAKRVFADMFSPVIMLLLGGFSLGSAVSKHGIAKLLASVVLDKAGSDPKIVILANMFVSTFASMWISNVAAPALCFPLISPILRNIPTSSTYAKALIMGIALAANVGGMASPISSPQNIIAMGIMNPSATWFEWFAIALPVCIVIDLCIWVLLLLIYQPKLPHSQQQQQQLENGINADPSSAVGNSGVEGTGQAAEPHINQYMTQEPLNATQWYILGVTFATIFLWCIENKIETVVGDMGVIALLPIIAFYGTGVLSKDDWNQQLWNVVMLAMGGICLGKAVDSSGLLAYITSLITPHLAGLSAYMCMFVFSLIVLVITSFISHTVGALIILPVVAEIGANMPDPQPRMLIMLIALVCSGAMGLPVSSFPNMNAISQQDAVGVPYISVVDFHKVGLLSSVVAWGAIVTLGYYATFLLGFK
ncbi:SPX-domain-containing protein [Rhizoclosmatium globosum]|uniref:SPX-domain-containing protein n=1 Tax=Rhizoclosmatium globosum TaxID=329046 RepID=A0A1Y2BUG5_9FUNG|nr:SPX-domain-containing protein [Rhizoclosmatium globosum]|eukprot:ORY38386.1 SPX-domain-containing protein [Rhizoclosmatium globosum]